MDIKTEGIYTLHDIRKSISNNKLFNFVCFSQEDKMGCFSLFSSCEFKDINGLKYSSLIHFTNARKAILFGDHSAHKKIMETKDLSEIIEIGQHIKHFDREKWDKVSSKFTYEGNIYKFSQNEKLFELIFLYSLDTIFVNCDQNDPKYGNGLSIKDPNSLNPIEWKGENMLGFQITKVRDTFLKSTSRGRFISYAYQDSISKIYNSDIVESIDLLSSGVTEINLCDHCNLRRLRVSKCKKLINVIIKNIPKLEVVDLLDDEHLQSIQILECPKLTTLDISFCEKLRKLNEIPSLKYLSAPKCKILGSFKVSDQLVYADVSDSSIDPIKFLKHSKKIECFKCSDVTIRLSDLTKVTTLKIFHFSNSKLICDKISSQNIRLRAILFDKETSIEGNMDLLNNFCITCRDKNPHVLHDITPKYQEYQRLLYGPWGVPGIDLAPSVIVEKPVISPPHSINQKAAADSIFGCLFASAAGDMLGAGTEGLTRNLARAELIGKKTNIAWTHPRCIHRNKHFVRATPTDDTSQCLLIVRSIIDTNTKNFNSPTLFDFEGVKIDPCDFGRKLIDWIEHGHPEHKQKRGYGVGSKTVKVCSNKNFLKKPFAASEEEWRKSGKTMFSNGCVMRIASSGCFAFWNEKVVVGIASTFAKMTHFDPRCVFSSVCAALLISRFIMWNSGLLSHEPDIDQTLSDAFNYVPEIEKYKKEAKFYLNVQSVDDLNLDEENNFGFCLKALGCGVWALRYCSSYEDAFAKVFRHGGDTDTNAAVVGAMLGAKLGFHSIPDEYIDFMFTGQWLYRDVVPYMQLMGIDVPPSPFLK